MKIFSNVYKTFNNENTIKIPQRQQIEQEKRIKESEEKIKTFEGAKMNEDNLPKEKKRIEEEWKKLYEEEKKKKKIKKLEEERRNIYEEMKKKKK